MFDECIRILSMIEQGEQKIWDLAQKVEIPYKRFREQIKKLLELNFIEYKSNNFMYSLTIRGENALRCVKNSGNTVGETPFIFVKP